jgi:hypothetical protein
VILLWRFNRPLRDSIRYEFRQRSSEHAPNTLPPPGVTIKRSADLAASENLCLVHGAWAADSIPRHKALVYSISPEGGSTALVTTQCALFQVHPAAITQQLVMERQGPPPAPKSGRIARSGMRASREVYRYAVWCGFRIIERQPCPPPWTRLLPLHASASPSAGVGSRLRTYLGAGVIPAWAHWKTPPVGIRRADSGPNCAGWRGTESR